MLIRRKVQTALAAVLLSAAVPGYVSAQLPGVTPDVIQKARQSGATEEQIQQALGGMSVPGTPQSGTNAGAGKSATGSADRKALDQKVLRDLNPTKVTGVDTLTWNQVLSNDWQLQQQQQRILQSMTTPYQDPEFEVLWEDGKFVRRPIPKVFGREIFQNKNLTFAPNYNMATPPSYVLGAGDEIVVEVWGPSELYDKQKITPDGTINIQGVGPISLNGLTIAEAQKRIASKLSGVMGGANVKVSLGQIRSIKVNIAGEVMVPGTYTLPSLATVFNAIYSAGGVNKIGSLRAIKVFRDGKEVATLDVYDYLINGKYDTNIRIEDNDMIIVQPYDSYVAVTGKVKRPRIYEMKKGETLAKAFEYAGGFTGDAYNDNVNVKRKTGRQYSILTVEKPDFDAFAVADGDSVSVGRIFNEYANRLVITGAVWRPGNYELTDNTATLSKLIAKAEGLKGERIRLARAGYAPQERLYLRGDSVQRARGCRRCQRYSAHARRFRLYPEYPGTAGGVCHRCPGRGEPPRYAAVPRRNDRRRCDPAQRGAQGVGLLCQNRGGAPDQGPQFDLLYEQNGRPVYVQHR